MAGFDQSSEEDKCFRSAEQGEVGASFTKDCAGKVEDVLSYLLAGFCCLEDIERGDLVGIYIALHARFVALFEH